MHAILKEAVDFVLACIALGGIIKAACIALRISRSNLLSKKTLSFDLADLRKSPPNTDDPDLKEAIVCFFIDLFTCGNRRVWTGSKIDAPPQKQ